MAVIRSISNTLSMETRILDIFVSIRYAQVTYICTSEFTCEKNLKRNKSQCLAVKTHNFELTQRNFGPGEMGNGIEMRYT